MTRQAIGRVAGEFDARIGGQSAPATCHARGGVAPRSWDAPGRESQGGRHAHGTGHVLGPGAPITLLAAAMRLRHDRRAAADPECPHPLGPLELVGPDGDQVGVERRTSRSTYGAPWTAST